MRTAGTATTLLLSICSLPAALGTGWDGSWDDGGEYCAKYGEACDGGRKWGWGWGSNSCCDGYECWDNYCQGDSSDDGFHGNHDDYYEGDDFEDEGGDDEGGDSDDCVALFGACATTANCCIDLECTDEACSAPVVPVPLPLPTCVVLGGTCDKDADCCSPYGCTTVGGLRVCAAKCGVQTDRCGADTERECCDGLTCVNDACVDGDGSPTPVTPTEPPVAPTTEPPVTPTCARQYDACVNNNDCCEGLECGNNGAVDLCVVPPMEPPVTPTQPPVTPTEPPVTPTEPPVTPMPEPVAPTPEPVAPTPVDPICIAVTETCKKDADCCAPYQCSTIGGARVCADKCGVESDVCGVDTERKCCSGFSCMADACVPDGGTPPTTPTEPPVTPTEPPVTPTPEPVAPTPVDPTCIAVTETCKKDEDCCAPYQCSTIGGARVCADKCGVESDVCGVDTERKCCSGFSCVADACVPDGGAPPTTPTEPPVTPTAPPVTPTEPPVTPTEPPVTPPTTPTGCSFEFEKCATTADCCNGLECGHNGLVDLCERAGVVPLPPRDPPVTATCADEFDECSIDVTCCDGLVCGSTAQGNICVLPDADCGFAGGACGSDEDCCNVGLKCIAEQCSFDDGCTVEGDRCANDEDCCDSFSYDFTCQDGSCAK